MCAWRRGIFFLCDSTVVHCVYSCTHTGGSVLNLYSPSPTFLLPSFSLFKRGKSKFALLFLFWTCYTSSSCHCNTAPYSSSSSGILPPFLVIHSLKPMVRAKIRITEAWPWTRVWMMRCESFRPIYMHTYIRIDTWADVWELDVRIISMCVCEITILYLREWFLQSLSSCALTHLAFWIHDKTSRQWLAHSN